MRLTGLKRGGVNNSVRNYDSMYFRQYTLKAEVDKAIHTLEWLISSITIDDQINKAEVAELENWVEQAVNLRKAGHGILIVHENDFWDEINL